MLSVRSPVSGTRIPAGNTAIILTDPYNDFLDPEGKLTPRLSESIKAVGTIENLRKVVVAARAAKLPIFYSLHHQHTAHDCERLYGRTTASNNLMLRSDMGWTYKSATNIGVDTLKLVSEGSWGAEIYPGLEPDLDAGDVVISKHWNSSYVFVVLDRSVFDAFASAASQTPTSSTSSERTA